MKAGIRTLLFAMFAWCFCFVGAYAFAQSSVVAPSDFLSQVGQAIQNFGGMSTLLKISTIILLIVASMKVSYLNTLIWSKLGNAQAWVPVLLGLIAGILGLGSSGPITLASVMAYVTAGAGAIGLHELLDTLKAVPGLGSVYVTVINFIEGILGGPAAQGAPTVPPSA